MAEQDDPRSEPRADIEAEQEGKVGGPDIQIDEKRGVGVPDIKPDESEA
jgi:hypothetical protein